MRVNLSATTILVLMMLLAGLGLNDASTCTLFSGSSNDTVLVGRNLDWEDIDGRIWIYPPEGKKFGLILFEQYGETLPFEGMNSQGLFMGENAVPDTETPFFLGKPLIISLNLIKVLLERCATVDDALALIPNYNVIFGTALGYPQIHFMLADKSGNSAIVEYYNNELRITRKANVQTYQLMTNFYVVSPDPEMVKANSSRGGYNRFSIADTHLRNMKQINVSGYKIILEACYNELYQTIWSNVYDLKNLEVHTFYKRNFNKGMTFNLEKEIAKGPHSYTLSRIFR